MITLEQHILNCLPYLVGEKTIIMDSYGCEKIHYGENFCYYHDGTQWVLAIYPQFQNLLKNLFDIDASYMHDIISKYIGIVDVYIKPVYVKRRRVRITLDSKYNLKGTLAYYYQVDSDYDSRERHNNKIISDDGRFYFTLKEDEYEFI